MQPSPKIAHFIQGYEKCERKMPDGLLHAYLPTPKDVPTIGWGSTGDDITMSTVWTQAHADARFAEDLERFGKGVSYRLGQAHCSQAQYDTMVSLAYNIGLMNFGNSTLLRKHIIGDYVGAAAEFHRWNRQGTKVLDGLTERRDAEAAIYRGVTPWSDQ